MRGSPSHEDHVRGGHGEYWRSRVPRNTSETHMDAPSRMSSLSCLSLHRRRRRIIPVTAFLKTTVGITVSTSSLRTHPPFCHPDRAISELEVFFLEAYQSHSNSQPASLKVVPSSHSLHRLREENNWSVSSNNLLNHGWRATSSISALKIILHSCSRPRKYKVEGPHQPLTSNIFLDHCKCPESLPATARSSPA